VPQNSFFGQSSLWWGEDVSQEFHFATLTGCDHTSGRRSWSRFRHFFRRGQFQALGTIQPAFRKMAYTEVARWGV
jgi:hypothetical protein